MPIPKSDVEDLQNDWECELGQIARKLKAIGPDTPLLKLMGSLAWGRYSHENGPPPHGKDQMLKAVGYLEGVRDTCMRAGQLNGHPGTELFERIYDGIGKRQKERSDLRRQQLAREGMKNGD